MRLDPKPWPTLYATCCTLAARRPYEDAPIDPHVADVVPTEAALTDYDKQHMITYMCVFDADQQGADWREVCRIVLRIDPDTEADRARQAFESHLSRARWMTDRGYRHLLGCGG
ncbi:DNA -binding domain-containing protein [Bradyrhizobium sp. URHC0002]